MLNKKLKEEVVMPNKKAKQRKMDRKARNSAIKKYKRLKRKNKKTAKGYKK